MKIHETSTKEESTHVVYRTAEHGKSKYFQVDLCGPEVRTVWEVRNGRPISLSGFSPKVD